MTQWLVDIVGRGFGQALQVDDVLYDHRSTFQRIQVATSPLFGRMLILDDAVQTTERDEYTYHEMLAHLPLLTHPGPCRVLIIGGGDGGTLEEVLKHQVETVTLVEIDREVVDVTRRFLPSIPQAAFDDPRTHLVIEDGIAFVEATREHFDVILVDSTDPKGPGVALFSEPFFRACAGALTRDGVLCVQSGSLLYQRDLQVLVSHHLSGLFPLVVPYWTAVPAYPGTMWTFTLASRHTDPRTLQVEKIASRIVGGLRAYSPASHHAALALPSLP